MVCRSGGPAKVAGKLRKCSIFMPFGNCSGRSRHISGTIRQELSKHNAFCINVVSTVNVVLSRPRDAFPNPSAGGQHTPDQQCKGRSMRHCAAALRHFVLCRVFFYQEPIFDSHQWCGRGPSYRFRVALVLDSQNLRIDQLTTYECSEYDRVRLRSTDVAQSSYLPSLLTYRIR